MKKLEKTGIPGNTSGHTTKVGTQDILIKKHYNSEHTNSKSKKVKKMKLSLKKLVDINGEPNEKFKSLLLKVLNRELKNLKIYQQEDTLILYGIEYKDCPIDILVESVIRGWMYRYGRIYKEGGLGYDPTDKNLIQLVME